MKKKIVIVGGGFGGVKAALELAKSELFEITLISTKDCFEYYPALYRVATGGTRIISVIPLGELFADKGIRIVIDEATKLDKKHKKITTKTGYECYFDSLILSLGMVTNFFGVEGLGTYAYTIKSFEAAKKFKRHIKDQLLDTSKLDMHYVVIGAGPTGVELAGALPEYIKRLCQKDGISVKKLNVTLVEGKDRVLPNASIKTSQKALKRLKDLGIHVLLNQHVNGQTDKEVIVGGKVIKSQSVVWTAGVANNPFYSLNGIECGAGGKVIVDEQLSIGSDIFVIGDNALTPYAGMAQTALYDAVFVADVIKAQTIGIPLPKYKPKKPASVVPIGHKWGLLSYGSIVIGGRIGWWLRVAADLIGYHDVEPWWKATGRVFSDRINEE